MAAAFEGTAGPVFDGTTGGTGGLAFVAYRVFTDPGFMLIGFVFDLCSGAFIVFDRWTDIFGTVGRGLAAPRLGVCAVGRTWREIATPVFEPPLGFHCI